MIGFFKKFILFKKKKNKLNYYKNLILELSELIQFLIIGSNSQTYQYFSILTIYYIKKITHF